MLNNFIYAQTKELFLNALNDNQILDEAIVFIEDTKEIWNHGHYFGGDSGIDPEILSGIETAIATLQSDKADKSELSDYAKKNELPSLDGYLTKTVADDLYATIAQYNALDTRVTNLTTNNIVEGDNLYFTNARAVSALSNTLASYVPTSRTINGKKLTGDITLSASDVGAASTGELNTINTNLANLTSTVDDKVDKVAGKDLSTYDFDDHWRKRINMAENTPEGRDWVDLQYERDNNKLIEGRLYRITDYVTTTTQENTRSAGHRFDIIVLALDDHTLAEEAWAIYNDEDSYFADNGANLSAWKIWYCLDNNKERFAWADEDNGKGVIYRMIDEWGNDCPYDFKNIVYYKNSANIDAEASKYGSWFPGKLVFMGANGSGENLLYAWQIQVSSGPPNTSVWFTKTQNITTETTFYNVSGSVASDIRITSVEIINYSQYTFGEQLEYDAPIEELVDSSLTGNNSNNTIGKWSDGLNGVLFDDDCHFNIIGGECHSIKFKGSCSSNEIGDYCHSISFGTGNQSNRIGDECYANVFGNDCYANILGNACHSNTFGDSCRFNDFGSNCCKNTLGTAFEQNIFGKGCYLNSFGESCHSNIFGNDCSSNTFGTNCQKNNFGNYCYTNSFGNECEDNSFGNECYANSFGSDCNNNSFGSGCNNNNFGNNCDTNSLGNECFENSFNNGCYNNSFGDGCHSNSFGINCHYNSFGNTCISNSLDNSCSANSFGNECRSNSLDGSYNSFGNNCKENIFDGYCYGNSFGNNCSMNRFGNYCYYNSFENSCEANTFGDECRFNSFGIECIFNSFSEYCCNNSFGNNCEGNSFGNGCYNNSFGNACHSNSFRISASTKASLKAYCYYNHFDDGCSYNVIWSSNTTSSGILLKNINVNRGVSGTSSSYNYINIALNSEKEININNYNRHIYIDYGDIFRVTYSELVDLRDNSQLIPGRQYRIIDYVTTTSQENTISAGHPFDVIVTALNKYTLSEEAQAIQNIDDGQGYFNESNLSAWKIWYSLDNDTERFAWAGDEIITSEEVEVNTHDSSECTIKSELIDDNAFITPFNFESCVWVDTDSDYNDGDNHDTYELIYEWDYFTDDNDNTHLCLYKSDADLYEEEGQPDYGDKYLYRGVVNVDGEEYDYWQKWDQNSESINVNGDGYVYATTQRIVSNPEAYSCETTTETIETVRSLNPKGVIYRMIDEWGNDCPYDFKNIQFKHPNDSTTYSDYYYTFSTVINGVVTDHSLLQVYCHDNIMKEHITSKTQTLNNNVFLNTSKISYCNSNSFGSSCYNNSFGSGCNSNSFGNKCDSNSFGNKCDSNSFGDSCYDNSFGDNYYRNFFGNSCHHNSFGNECYSNSFKDYCNYNSFGDGCESNSFGNDCNNSSFGDDCDSNSFGDDCDSNSFGNKCSYNSFGNYCYVISFKDYCRYNSFGNKCFNNSFGNYCSYNSFGNNCDSNSFRVRANIASSLKDYVQYNHFDDGCSDNVIWNDDTTSSSVLLKNINVNRGLCVIDMSSNYINIDVLNQDYEIQVAKNSNGEIKIYCEADLIA